MNDAPDDSEIAERLVSAVPEAPAPTGWGSASRLRHRRARRARSVGAVLGVAALVAAVAVVPRVVGGGDAAPAEVAGRSTAATPSTPDGVSAASLEQGCPDPDTELVMPQGNGIEPGAVGVRLCLGTNEFTADLPDGLVTRPDRTGPSTVPLDELTEDVDAVAEAANLPEIDDGVCTSDAGPTFVLWFRYPDGQLQTTTYDDFGCHRGFGALAAFSDQLSAQRSSRTPPVITSTPHCDGGESVLLVPPPLDLVAVSVCRSGPDHESAEPLSPELVAQIPTDPEITYVTTRSMNACQEDPVQLVGVNAWGDAITLFGQCGAFRMPNAGYGDGEREPVWQPTGELGDALYR